MSKPWLRKCIVLYCIVLYCIVLYCIVLYYIVLYDVSSLYILALFSDDILCFLFAGTIQSFLVRTIQTFQELLPPLANLLLKKFLKQKMKLSKDLYNLSDKFR